jgi:hypothetical protein
LATKIPLQHHTGCTNDTNRGCSARFVVLKFATGALQG